MLCGEVVAQRRGARSDADDVSGRVSDMSESLICGSTVRTRSSLASKLVDTVDLLIMHKVILHISHNAWVWVGTIVGTQ